MLRVFVTTPRGMESLLSAELRTLGLAAVNPGRAGANLQCNLEAAYRICLWSRVASRVLLSLSEFTAPSTDALYEGISQIDWSVHFGPDDTFAVDVSISESKLKHSHYAALKVKDAIVDQFRGRFDRRPSVNLDRPAIRVNINIFKNNARVSLDLSGQGLHRRGYRDSTTRAPLKENLAAAILLQSEWPSLCADGAPLIDPMCGSGTIVIEAALMAADIAPGFMREYYGFLGWRGHDASLWKKLVEEANDRRCTGLARPLSIVGYDVDRSAIKAAISNVQRAGLIGKVHIEKRDINALEGRSGRPGLIVVNPPYGERLNQNPELPRLYSDLGTYCKQSFPAWRLCVFTGNTSLMHRLRLPLEETWNANNGALACKLFRTVLPAEATQRSIRPAAAPEDEATATNTETNLEMFANRLRKNWRRLSRWANRNNVACFRVYDADLPDFAIVIDYYSGSERWAHVHEYRAPATIVPAHAASRLHAAMEIIPQILDVPDNHVFLKVRERQRGDAQYAKVAHQGVLHSVYEQDRRYLVNFTDYLDTGLFLDHRPIRRWLADNASERRFLNLFCYTGTATIAAACGGAAKTTSVDLSPTYIEWASRNLELNSPKCANNELVQADCREWLAQAARTASHLYDLIFLDPPTFSNSKRMDGTFDVLRDHPQIINDAMSILATDGVLVFSTNRRHFALDESIVNKFRVIDITSTTIDEDFVRRPKIHSCWTIKHR